MEDVKAVTRIEAILNGEDITPVTREEAILSGADVEPLSREEYFVQKRLGGGGGGLDYVIPEQMVTVQNHEATLQNLNTSSLEDGDIVIAKITVSEIGTSYQTGTYDDNEISFAPTSFGVIDTTTGVWYMSEAEDGMQFTISVILGF